MSNAVAQSTPDTQQKAEQKKLARRISTSLKKSGLSIEAIKPNPESSAEAAGLRYVSDEEPGIRRKKAGKGFSYTAPDGTALRDKVTLDRIRALAIPPAYRNVWICARSDGHIQATGLDERGRKQYRYHPRWRDVRDEAKYARMMAFGQALPLIRERTQADLQKPGMPREKVLAAVVQLLEKTAIRVGNEEYARQNQSFGLTTLRNGHAQVKGSKVHFEFKGKSNKFHAIDLHDRRLARVVSKLQDLPGQALFQYLDENKVPQSVSSEDVNTYLQEITGQPFTAKDFRTWTGTVLASLALREFERFDSHAQARKNVMRAIESVAERLGNTPTVCRKCYVHPAIFDSYLDGSLLESLQQEAKDELAASLSYLKPEEAAIMALLQNRLAQAASESA
jgi:DNA topoisomerase-1